MVACAYLKSPLKLKAVTKMDCPMCHELLSDYLDHSLTGEERARVTAHLHVCATCAAARDELQSIAAFAASEYAAHEDAPSNANGLWLNIQNEIENDLEWAQKAKTVKVHRRENFFKRIWNAHWQVSAPQAAFASFALVAAVSTAVTFGIVELKSRTASRPDNTSRATSLTSVSARSRLANVDAYVRQQQAETQYLMQRVENSKNRFSPKVRESYERSLASLERTVNESVDTLRRNPQDALSEKMLNTALREKQELVREFSDF